MSVGAERYAQVFDLFSRAREADAGTRAQILADAPADVRREVEQLLGIDAKTRDGHDDDRVAASVESAAAVLLAQHEPPETIGPYRILDTIAHGGQGTVYRAEQAQPRRTVALKVLRASFVAPEALRRFEIETEALARLEHPFIAPIYDAGALDAQGTAVRYFAMQWIDGKPLDVYADDAGLEVRARLALLADVCSAVEHAHRKGIIHRDLKPANILVESDGRPKVLDFGVARATGSDLDAATLATTTGQVVGTLPFMSPEQITGDPDAIDTRSDVYALGVLLHLLLVGEVPHAGALRSVGEAARSIQEATPTLLGRRNPTLRGDVETIVAKALAKDPARRYGSAAALEADMRRHLADEPILARPPSALYVLGRFARRRKALVGALGALALALVVGVVVSMGFAARAREQARQARARGAALRVETARTRLAAAAAALAAAEPRTATRHLDAIPADLRAWEWHVLHAQTDHSLPLEGPVRIQADGVVVASSTVIRDGTLGLVVAGGDAAVGTARWRTVSIHTGKTLEDVEIPAGHGHCLAPSGDRVACLDPDSHLIEVARDGDLARWPDAGVYQLLGYVGVDPYLVGLAPTSDERRELRLLDMRGRRVIGRWQLREPPEHFAADPQGRFFAVATARGDVWIFPATSGGSARRVRPHPHRIADLAFTHDGAELVSVGLDGAIVRTKSEDGTQSSGATLEHMGPGRMAMSRDGRAALMVDDGTVRVFDVHRASPQVVLHGHDALSPSLRPAWSPEGTWVVTITRSGTIRHWHPSADVAAPAWRAHEGAILHMSASRDGRRLVSVGTDGTIAMWDTLHRQELGRIRAPHTTQVRWEQNDERLRLLQVAGARGRWVTLRTSDGEHLESGSDAPSVDGGHGRGGHDLIEWTSFADGTRHAVASQARGLEIRDATAVPHRSAPEGPRLLSLGRATRRTTCLEVLHDDGALWAGAEDGTIRVWRPWSYARHRERMRTTASLRTATPWGADTDLSAGAEVATRDLATRVELLETGDEPRAALSLGAAGPLDVEATWGQGFRVKLSGAGLAPVKLHPASATLRLAPDPAATPPWTPTLHRFARSASSVVRDTKPRDAELRDVIAALWCPLPREAVGIGARWRMTRIREGAGGREHIEGVFELVARTAEGAEIRGTFQRESPDLLRSLPGLPKTIEARATAARETTTAHFVVRADLPLPAEARVTREAVIEVNVKARGAKPSLGFEARTEITATVRRAR